MQRLFYTKKMFLACKSMVLFISMLSVAMTASADGNVLHSNVLHNSDAMHTIQQSMYNTTKTQINKRALQKEREYIPVDYTTLNISDYKLAVMHVLAEICPSLIGAQKIAAFEQNFELKISRMLPDSANPKVALKILSTKNNYQKIFASMKTETLNNFSNDENKALCEDFANNQF